MNVCAACAEDPIDTLLGGIEIRKVTKGKIVFVRSFDQNNPDRMFKDEMGNKEARKMSCEGKEKGEPFGRPRLGFLDSGRPGIIQL